MDAGVWISVVGIAAGLAAFVAGLRQYIIGQQWKRAEFVAAQIKEFEAYVGAGIAMTMLDWNVRTIQLFPSEEEPTKQWVNVNDKILAAALIPHTQRPNFTHEEAAIRDAFDQFFDGFERFEHYIQSCLVSPKDFQPYIGYWIEIIGNPRNERKPAEVRNSLWKYIHAYYAPVQRFFARYGYNIRPS